jgi:hypothetical protein
MTKMPGPRVEALLAKLEKGGQKTQIFLSGLTPELWTKVLYEDPAPWTIRDLACHFLSAEDGLLRIAADTAAGGEGAPEGFDFDRFNAEEQCRLADLTPAQVQANLAEARRRTLEWAATLEEDVLDRVGRHPALGQVPVETMILAIYGHQLMHMRDLQAALRQV